ncbi:hypothetical protein NMG60_11002714 [Bertholletia excelsa]
MDWFSWLSKTGLHPSLVYDYGLSFFHNELEQEDIAYLDHEFLQSMGISIAKHRLEILKLAWKEKKHPARRVSRLVLAVKRAKTRLSHYFHTWVHRDSSGFALVIAPRRGSGPMAAKRERKVAADEARLLLTDGREVGAPGSGVNTGFSVPVVVGQGKMERDGHWCSGLKCGEEIKWDAMFQDLKPT